jgi:hypothetical protein
MQSLHSGKTCVSASDTKPGTWKGRSKKIWKVAQKREIDGRKKKRV